MVDLGHATRINVHYVVKCSPFKTRQLAHHSTLTLAARDACVEFSERGSCSLGHKRGALRPTQPCRVVTIRHPL
jgi:hypothetical protein